MIEKNIEALVRQRIEELHGKAGAVDLPIADEEPGLPGGNAGQRE